jgi:hypothetical protein
MVGPASDAREIDDPLTAEPWLKNGEDMDRFRNRRRVAGFVMCQGMCEGSQIERTGSATRMPMRRMSKT